MENINIASFDFDETKITKKLAELDKLFEDFNKKRKKEIENLDGMTLSLTGVVEAINKLNKETNTNSKAYDELAKKQEELIKQIAEQKAKIAELNQKIIEQKKEQIELNKAKKEAEKQSKAEAKALEQIARANEILNNGYDTENKSINQLREDRKALIKLRNDEVAIMGEQSERAKQLNKLIAEMTNQEKALVSETEKRFYQIGDYAGQLQGSFQGVIDAMKEIGSGNVLGGIDNLKNSFNGLVTSARAFVATPIGAVVTALAGFAVVAKYLYDYNTEMAEATRLTQQFTGLTGDELENVTVRAKNLAEQTSSDLKEVINSVNAVARAYGISYEEAFEKVEKGYVRAGESAEDFFDNTSEYIIQFKNAGYSADEFFSILEAGAKNGTYKDKIVDSIKEMDLRLKEFSKATSDALINAFGVGFTDKLQQGLEKGTITTKQALDQINKEADKVGLNFQQKQTLVADVFSAMGEDAGGFVKVLDSISDGLNNTDRELTEVEQAQKRVIDATNEYEQAFADLFNTSGGGFETMKADFKVMIYEFLTKAIETIKDLANGFVEVYNNSMLVRVVIQGLIGIFKNLGVIAGGALKTLWTGLETTANLLKSVLTFDLEGIKSSLTNGFKEVKTIAVNSAKDIVKNANDAFKNMRVGTLSEQTYNNPSFGSAQGVTDVAGGSGSKTPEKEDKKRKALAAKRLKEQQKEIKEAEKAREQALKLEQKYLEELAKLTYDYAQDELANQIKVNAEKIKNAEILSEEMLRITQGQIEEETRLKKQQLDEELERNKILAQQRQAESYQEIEQLKISEQEKQVLKNNADQVLKQQLLNNEQEYGQRLLEVYAQQEEQTLAIEEQFYNNRQAIEQQRKDFEFQQKMLRLENEGIAEADMNRILLAQQYAEEMALLRDQLNNKLITQKEFEDASENLTKWRVKREQEIEEIANENKRMQYASMLSGVADLFEQNTAAYKLTASAAALIDTYGAANKALNDKTVPNFYLRAINAGVAVATGLANVAKINKVNTKSGGNSVGSSTPTSLGTTTNTYQSQYAGGALTGLDGISTISGYNQANTFGNINDPSSIANAVREGAESGARQGSQSGIRDLSTDRNILDASGY